VFVSGKKSEGKGKEPTDRVWPSLG